MYTGGDVFIHVPAHLEEIIVSNSVERLGQDGVHLWDFVKYMKVLRRCDVKDFIDSLVDLGVFRNLRELHRPKETLAVLWLLYIQIGESEGRQESGTPVCVLKRVPLNQAEFLIFIGSVNLKKHFKKILPPVKAHINGLNTGKPICTSVDRTRPEAVRFAEYLGFVKIETGLGNFDYYLFIKN